MYPIKLKKKMRKVLVKELFLKLIDDGKVFFDSLESPRKFIIFLKKSFYF